MTPDVAPVCRGYHLKKEELIEYIFVMVSAQVLLRLHIPQDLICVSLFTYAGNHITHSDIGKTLSPRLRKFLIYLLQVLIVGMDLHSFYEIMFLQEREFLMLFIHLYASGSFYALDQFWEHIDNEDI